MNNCNVKLYNPIYSSPKLQSAKNDSKTSQNNNIETSIYKQKGINIPFCGLAKGTDEIEELCIKMLRRVRENRYRKYDEEGIKEIVSSLHQIKNSDEKKAVLEEIFEVKNENNKQKLDKNFIKNLVNINANRSESQRYAVLDFAQYELDTATKPMIAFSKLTKEQQDKLTPIIEDIGDVISTDFFKSTSDMTLTQQELYDTLRIPIYAHEDLAKLQGEAAKDYKIENLKILHAEKKHFDKSEIFTNNSAKQKAVSCVEKIIDYFMENLL